MSFWNSLKPAVKVPVVVDLKLEAGKTLELTWDDGAKTSIDSRTLRQHCPCAECIDEWSGQVRLDRSQVKPDMTVTQLTQVGNYALGLTFADGHRTGIFNWKLLRELSR
ncbi:MAG: DUF971 domain-containing protein [Myxococcaceae bacterium]|nr:DUF971 domain-containing protein [Myxococcaceae bacterium]